ncbi:MAG: hypothetical protein ABL898_12870 [Hyphomicrobiaceae bacterium]
MTMPALAGLMSEIRAREYLVRNCGFIDVEFDGGILKIRLRQKTLSINSVVGLCYLIADLKPNRTVAHWLDTPTWRHEILPAAHKDAITCLVGRVTQEPKESQAPRVLRQALRLDTLERSSPLFLAAQTFLRSEGTSKRAVADVLERCVGGRYIFIDHVQSQNTLVVSEVGKGVPHCARQWAKSAIGQEIRMQPDDDYAAYCHEAYGFVAKSGQPLLEAVDAIVQWPNYPEQRRRYYRLIAAMGDGQGARWLAGVSLPDASINLRGTFNIAG